MQIFYVPELTHGTCVMDKNESRHCIKVLRMKKGDPVNIVDGKGNLYECIITEPDPQGCMTGIKKVISGYGKRNYRLHLAVSPVKNLERFDWMIEKTVEIGVDAITPVICTNTEKPDIKHERINNIIISAMKQSEKAYRPVLNKTILLSEFLKSEPEGIRMIAHCNSLFGRKTIGEVYGRDSDAVILIGPEGDFTGEEISRASVEGFLHVHLGPSRLRTETAGIAACHSVYFINQ